MPDKDDDTDDSLPPENPNSDFEEVEDEDETEEASPNDQDEHRLNKAIKMKGRKIFD